MKFSFFRVLVVVAAGVWFSSPVEAQNPALDDGAGTGADVVETEENAKALKYHGVLVKRPGSGYLFDRFFGAWLEGGTVESLENFLKGRSDAEDAATGDRLLLAFFYTKQGEDALALEVFEEALVADPGNAEAWLEKARAEARTLDFVTALEDLDKALGTGADEEQKTEIGKLKGRLLVRSGESEKALEVWRALLADNPDDEELHEDVIELLVDEGLYDEAIKTSQLLTERTKDAYQKVQRQLVTGDLYQRAGNREQALAAYAESLKQTGYGTWIEREILAQIEQLFRREDDIDGLAGYLGDLLDEEGKRMALRQRRAGVLAEMGEDEDAIAAWKEILELTPGERAVREAYVAVLAKMQRFEQAVAQMEALVELHPDDGELKVALAELQYSAEDGVAAGETVAAFLAGSDGSEYAHLRAARLLQRFELEKKSEEVFKKLLVAFPESAGAKEAYANFLFDSKRRDEALAMWKQLAGSDDPAQVIRVGRALAARGEAAEAFGVLRQRYESLNNDGGYLGQLIELALRADQADSAEVFQWVRRRLLLAQSAEELTDVTSQALLVARQSGDEEKLIADLRADEKPSVRELCLLAELINESGDPEAADAVLTEAGNAAEISEEEALLVLAQQARLFGLRKDWSGAAETLRVAVELPGGRKSSTVQSLVDLYQRALMTEEALKWIVEWKKLSPGSEGPWLREAEIQWAAGDIEAGLQTLRGAARRFDDSEEVRLKLAQTLADAGKMADAELIYWQLYDEAEDSLKKLNWVGKLSELAVESGRLDHLIQRFDERRRQNRSSVVPLLALAEIYGSDGRYEERREAILEASRVQPNDVGLLHQLAGIDEAEGNFEDALKSLEKALELDKTDRTQQRVVRLHFLQGEYEKAFEVLRGGLDATDPYLIEEVYGGIIRGGEWARAVKFLQPFLAAHPDNYRLQYLYATALEEDEQYDRASDAFAQLLDYDKELPPRSGTSQNQQNYVMYGGAYYNDPAQLEKARREMAKVYPAEAIEMQELQNSGTQAYAYRMGLGEGRIYGFSERNMGYRGGWYGGAVTMSIVQPPNSVAAVRAFAFSHLIKIQEKSEASAAAGADDTDANADASETADAEKIAELAQRYGIPALYVEWIGMQESINELPAEEQSSVFSEWMEKHPENETVHALWAMGWGARSNGGDTAGEMNKVFQMFRDTRPILALAAASAGSTRIVYSTEIDEKQRELARSVMTEAIALAAGLEDFSSTIYQQLFSQLRYDLQLRNLGENGGSGGREPLLTEEQRATISGLLKKWQPEMIESQGKGVPGQYVRQGILYLSAMEGDMEALVAGLEEENERFAKELKEKGHKAAAGANQASYQQLAYQQSAAGGNGFDALAFPPPAMPDIAPVVSTYLLQANRNYGGGASDWATEENAAALKELLPGVEDPLLRVLLATRVGETADDIRDAAIEEVLALDPPTASSLMLSAAAAIREAEVVAADAEEAGTDKAAAKAASDAKLLAGAVLLDKARYGNIPDMTSQVIDNALIILGLSAEEDSDLFEKGKAASLRVRAALKPDQRQEMQQLAETLRRFGLDKEATRLSIAASRSQNSNQAPSAVSSAMMGAAPNPEILAQKIKTLLEQDKREAAVKTAVTQIKKIATGLFSQDSTHLEYQLRELRQQLEAGSLTEELIEAAAPEEGAGLVDRVQFAALCEAVGDEERAIEEYRELIKERSKDDAIRMRLVVLLSSRDIDAALEQMDQIKSSDALTLVGQTISNRVGNAETFTERFELVETALKLLKHSGDEMDQNNSYWVENVRQSLANNTYAEDMRLPPMMQKWERKQYENYSGYNAEKFDKMLERRNELHQQFCLAMMEIPEFAARGFGYYATVVRAAGEETDGKLIEMAREVVMKLEKSAFVGNGYSLIGGGSSNWSGSSRSREELDVLGPIETLVVHAYENEDREFLYDDVLPALEKAGNDHAEVEKALRSYADLYFCKADEFGAAVEALDELPAISGSYGKRFTMRIAADVFLQRDIDYDLRPMVEGIINDKSQRQTGVEDALPHLISAISEKGGEKKAKAVIEKYAESLLGPADERLDFIKRHYQPNSWSGNTPNGDIHTFEEFLSNCGQFPRLVFPAVEMAATLRLGKGGRLYQLEYPFTDRSYLQREDYAGELLLASGLSGPLEELEPFDASAFQRMSQIGKRTVIGVLIDSAGSIPEDQRGPVKEFIEAAGDSPPFGVALLAAQWEKDADFQTLKVFHEAAGAIAALPEEQQVRLAAMATDIIDPSRLPSDLNAGLSGALQNMQELAGTTANDEYDEFMAAKVIEDLSIRPYQLDDRAETLIERLLKSDVDQAIAAFGKTMELVEIGRRTGGITSRYNGGRTYGGELIDDIIRGSRSNPLEVILFEIGLAESEEIPPMTIFTRPKNDYIARGFDTDNLQGKDARTQLAAVKDTFGKIAQALGEEPSKIAITMAGPVFYEVLNRLRNEVSEQSIEWLQSNAPEVTAHPRLALEALMAARQVWAYKSYFSTPSDKREGTQPKSDPEADAYYVAILEDATIPSQVRMMVVSHLLGSSRPRMSDGFVQVASDHLIESWSGDDPVSDGQAILVLNQWVGRKELPERLELGKKLAGAFQVRYLSGRAPIRIQGEPEERTLLQLLKLNLEVGENAAANQLLAKFDDSMSDLTTAFQLLVRAGENGSAARLLRMNDDKVGNKIDGTTWDEELSTSTATFLDSIDRVETRVLAHAVLAATPDPKPEEKSEKEKPVEAGLEKGFTIPGGDRTARLTEVAVAAREARKSGELKSTQLFEQVLALIALEPAAAEVVPDLYDEAAGKMTATTLFAIDDSRVRDRRMSLVETHWLLSLMKGEGELYAERIVDAFQATSSSSYNKRKFLTRAVKLPHLALAANEHDPDTFEALLPAWKPLLTEVVLTKETGILQNHVGRLLFDAVEADRVDRFFRWIEEQSEEGEKKVMDAFKRCGSGLYPAAAQYYNERDLDIEARKAFFGRLFASPDIDKINPGFATTAFLQAISAKFFTLDEVLEHGEEMGLAHPRDGFAWEDMAAASERKRKKEQAVDYWQRAVAAGRETRRTISEHRFRAGLANALERVGRKEDAKAEIEAIQVELLGEGKRKLYDSVRKRLGMKPVPKGKPTPGEAAKAKKNV